MDPFLSILALISSPLWVTLPKEMCCGVQGGEAGRAGDVRGLRSPPSSLAPEVSLH